MADIIYLTDGPIRNASAATQELRLALDVSAYDELDLLLTMQAAGASITVQLITGMQLDTVEGWVPAGTFSALAAQGEAKLNVQNFLRYLRWDQTTASTATFDINGIGRRWA